MLPRKKSYTEQQIDIDDKNETIYLLDGEIRALCKNSGRDDLEIAVDKAINSIKKEKKLKTILNSIYGEKQLHRRYNNE